MQFQLGSANFGNSYKSLLLPEGECFAIMDKAWELGIRTIDTARGYGDSEKIIAKWINSTGNRFKVYTKGRSDDDFKQSEDILGMAIHAKLWHNYAHGDEITCQIDGVSCYNMEWFDLMHQTDISIIQVPWNIIDRSNTLLQVCPAITDYRRFAGQSLSGEKPLKCRLLRDDQCGTGAFRGCLILIMRLLEWTARSSLRK